MLALVAMTIDQDIEGLFLDTPAPLVKLSQSPPHGRAYAVEIKGKDGLGREGITQVISVVVTDLDKVSQRPTAEQALRLHERGARTRPGFAGQLMKVTDTTLDGNPMTVLLGSVNAPGVGTTRVNAFHVSSATVVGNRAYEVTWMCFYGGTVLDTALKAVSNIRIKKDDAFVAPKAVVGKSGEYTLLGVPFVWILPNVPMVSPHVAPAANHQGRYQSFYTAVKYTAYVEIVQLKEDPGTLTPEAMFAEFHRNWMPKENPPKAVLKDGVHVFEDLTPNSSQVGRAELAQKGKTLVGLFTSAKVKADLPVRESVSIKSQ